MSSVAEAQVEAFRQNLSTVLQPSLIAGLSHLLSYWVHMQPLGQLLNEAVDGGELLHSELWHPLRAPMVHMPSTVHSLANRIEAAWEAVKEMPQDDGEWLAGEVNRLLRLFRHAAILDECVVNALDLPADEDRARRTRIPWKPK
jgi:hypothetical protein